MYQEANEQIKIAVALLIIGVILSTVVVLLVFSVNANSEAIDTLEKSQADSYDKRLRNMLNTEGSVWDVSEIFQFLDTAEPVIESISGTVDGVTINSASDLRKVVTSKVLIDARYSEELGMYKIIVSDAP